MFIPSNAIAETVAKLRLEVLGNERQIEELKSRKAATIATIAELEPLAEWQEVADPEPPVIV